MIHRLLNISQPIRGLDGFSMRGLFILFLVVFQAFQLRATEVDSLWNSAVNSYSEERYADALEQFKTIEESGWVSARLYYNIANCFFKQSNQLGSAILYYEKALKEDPGFKDAEVNLNFARQFILDRIDSVPDFILITWIAGVKNLLGADLWAWISIICALAVATLLLLFRYGKRAGMRKSSFIFAMISLILFIISLIFSVSSMKEYTKESEAIVMIPVTSVKASPAEGAKSVFILHEGTKVELIEELGKWIRIEIADGRQGWIDSRDLEKI